MLSKRSGFTLIELVVVIGIIVFLAGFSLVSLKSFTRTRTLDALADRIAFSIRRAQVRVFTGERAGSSRPPGGYGVAFTTCAGACTYTVFADVYPGLTPNHSYDVGSDLVVVQETLPNTIRVTSVSPTANSSVVFAPPQGMVYINGGTVVDLLTLRIQPMGSAEYRDIQVDRRSGRVTVLAN